MKLSVQLLPTSNLRAFVVYSVLTPVWAEAVMKDIVFPLKSL